MPRTVTVYYGNRIDAAEALTLDDLHARFLASDFARAPYVDGWPCARRVGAWLSTFATMDEHEQVTLTNYIAQRGSIAEASDA